MERARGSMRLALVLGAAILLVVAGTPVAAADDDQARRLHDLGVSIFVAAREDPATRAEAIRLLEHAVALAPTDSRYRLDLADAYLHHGRPPAVLLAILLYKEVLAEDPGADAVRARLADAYAAIGNAQAALDFAASRLLWSGTVNPRAALQIAALAAITGDIERGIAELERGLRHAPGTNLLRLLLAPLYADRGARDRARALLDAILATESPGTRLAAEAARLRAEIAR